MEASKLSRKEALVLARMVRTDRFKERLALARQLLTENPYITNRTLERFLKEKCGHSIGSKAVTLLRKEMNIPGRSGGKGVRVGTKLKPEHRANIAKGLRRLYAQRKAGASPDTPKPEEKPNGYNPPSVTDAALKVIEALKEAPPGAKVVIERTKEGSEVTITSWVTTTYSV